MEKTIVITQPTYLPWLGYFQQVAKADVFVFLDTVQFVQRSWHSRNRLKTHSDQVVWLTVPVAKHSQKSSLLDILISPNQTRWNEKHLGTIQTCLGSTKYFTNYFASVSNWLSSDWQKIVDLNISGITLFSSLLNISPHFIRASELNLPGKRTELLVNICEELGGTKYYTSSGSKDYLDDEIHLFHKANIDVTYQTWEHPIYPQKGKTFISHLSVLDAIMNVGTEATRSMILVS